jgi:hypothetical protein
LKEAYDDLKISPFFMIRVFKSIKNFAIALIDDDELSKETSEYFNPHSARNGRKRTIMKQAQGVDSIVGRQEKRNSKKDLLIRAECGLKWKWSDFIR